MRTTRKWTGLSALAGLLVLSAGSALAQAPVSDDWSTGKLQSVWTFEAIGDNQGNEAQAIQNGDMMVTAGGADVWTAPDNFVYVFQKASGNFRVTVKIDSGSLVAPADTYSKAGLMIRSTDDPAAAYTYLFESPRRSGILWEMRQDDSGTNQSQSPNNQQLPAWLRLTRLNGVIIPSYSADGVHFSGSGSPADANQDATVTSPVFGLPGLKNDPVLVGLATTAHNTTQSAAALYGKFVGMAVQAGTITGTAMTADGKPFAAGPINLTTTDGTDSETVNTDANGKFSIPVVAGDWNVSAGGVTTFSDPVKVSVAANGTGNAALTVKTIPTISLATASTDTTVAAKETSDPMDAAAVDNTNLGPIAPAFDDSKWSTVNMPEDLATTDMLVANNSWYWYRVSFKLPASFQSAKGGLLHLNGFNVDDGDFTFINGHYIGATVNNWSAVRNYAVPSDYINWTSTNVVSILGQQGGGGAGNGTAADIMMLSVAKPTESGVFGRVVTKTGAAVGGVTLTLTDSKGVKSSATSNNVDGGYNFIGLAAGSYTLTASGPLSTLPAPAAVTTTGGQSTIVPDITTTGTGFGPADLAAVDVTKLANNDIGASGDKGTLKVTGSQVDLTAGGADIWNAVDDFSFAASPTQVTGDFTAVVDATPAAGITDWTKAGIMARVDMTPGSQNVIALNSFYYGPRLQWRATAGGASNSAGSNDIPNKTLMLTRSGDIFTVYRSNSDGSNANLVGQTTLAGFPKTLNIGLAATSHTVGTLGTATFQNFKLSSKAFNPSGGGTPSLLLGDPLNLGKIAIGDATFVLQVVVKLKTPTADQAKASDVDKDGDISIKDVTKILQAIVNGTGF